MSRLEKFPRTGKRRAPSRQTRAAAQAWKITARTDGKTLWRFARWRTALPDFASMRLAALCAVALGLGSAAVMENGLPDLLPFGAPALTVPSGTDATGTPISSADTISANFSLCHSGGGINCVVDGDTIWLGGEKIRIADIDTPETHPPRCAQEARLGAQATQRLQALLNEGPFSLESIDRDTDRYGRKLRVLTRDGASIGGTLVSEGLARYYGSGRQPWC